MRVCASLRVHDHEVDEFDHADLSPGMEYLVIGMDDDHFRVVNGLGEPILYPRGLFLVTDPAIPTDWIHQQETDGRTYIDPPECAAPGFYEDYFDGDPKAIAALQRIIKQLSS